MTFSRHQGNLVVELELDVSNKLLVFLNVALWYVKKMFIF